MSLTRLRSIFVRASLVLLAGTLLSAGALDQPRSRYGSIVGTVRDQAGAPITNAMVIVVGTKFGSTTLQDGTYRIDSIPAGTVVLQASFIGYKAVQFHDLVVIADSVLTQDIALEATPFEVEGITVTGAVNPLVPRDQVASRQRVVNSYEQASISTDRNAAAFGNAAAALLGDSGGSLVSWLSPGTEEYRAITENRFLGSVANPLSTFAIDVDAASYSNSRRFISSGVLPPPDAVRIEEFINYFPYRYAGPADDHPFAIHTAIDRAPWNADHYVVRIALQGRRMDMADLPSNNLVFLIDCSGSMLPANKLPLVKRAMRLLVQQLRPQDRVAIVAYAGAAGLVLPPTSAEHKSVILAAIDNLESGGSTAGGRGIKLAYDVAAESFLEEGNNRVILATDGDFNVGLQTEGQLIRLIEERRDLGVFLTVLGVGTGNIKDARMEALADKGNGHFAYLDNLLEARKVLVEEAGATLLTIAKDVKIQVEFNPATVAAYRLIGYENRLMPSEDFNDDTKDGGELGAGHSVTALYEVIPVGLSSPDIGAVDPLRYSPEAGPASLHLGEILTVKLRYKQPDGDTSRLLTRHLTAENTRPDEDFRWALAVAEFGMLLRDSRYKGGATFSQVVELASAGRGEDTEGYRAEFLRLVKSVSLLSATGG